MCASFNESKPFCQKSPMKATTLALNIRNQQLRTHKQPSLLRPIHRIAYVMDTGDWLLFFRYLGDDGVINDSTPFSKEFVPFSQGVMAMIRRACTGGILLLLNGIKNSTRSAVFLAEKFSSSETAWSPKRKFHTIKMIYFIKMAIRCYNESVLEINRGLSEAVQSVH